MVFILWTLTVGITAPEHWVSTAPDKQQPPVLFSMWKAFSMAASTQAPREATPCASQGIVHSHNGSAVFG